jgi:hypothetical protein
MAEMAAAIDIQTAASQQPASTPASEPAESLADGSQQPGDESGARRVAGRENIGQGGYLTAIAGARRHVLNKVESLAWIQGVQHFQATNGRLPKDHDEFMKQIVEPLGIDLGYKEENQEFLYAPSEGQFGTLYVVEKGSEPAQPQQ